MTTRDKISQAYLLLSGDATKMIVKKATTRIDDPPKKKHLLTLSQHCLNPRADLCHVFDCLSTRERKPDWRIASKALITMHHLLKTGNQRLWNTVASRPTIFDLCGYVDNSSHIAITMSPYVMNYAEYLAIKCESFRNFGKDITKNEYQKIPFHLTQIQEVNSHQLI
uniref:Clathrin coat assembly protein AP180 (Trinotate prediction) n=1 Tax=Myxobolus squamalis TaxID=59785 RepID=A0A6B2FXA3_MYXSQ